MQPVEHIHPELLDILSTFTEWFDSQDRSKWRVHRSKMDPDYGVSAEYLDAVRFRESPKHAGFPEEVVGVDLAAEPFSEECADVMKRLDAELLTFFGCKFNAVKMFYPGADGFMGWHHNANCPGYNILLSYNKQGDGFFRYLDPKTQQIVTMEDKQGWNVKVGYYGSWTEPELQYWHCARAKTDRFTLGYVIPHKGLWEDMVAELSGYPT